VFRSGLGWGGVTNLRSLKESEALAREALGADDGIAAETETPEAEPASPESGSAPEASAARSADSRVPEQVGNVRPAESRPSAPETDANADAELAGEKPGES